MTLEAHSSVPVSHKVASIDRALLCAIALASLAAASCEIKASDACDPHQVYSTGGGAVLRFAVCVCDEANGYVFDVQHGYGCKQCARGQVIKDSKCVTPAPDAGMEDFDSSASMHAPSGVGEDCRSDADCKTFDAKFCAPGQNKCVIDKCATGENKCPSDSACCDYSALLSGLSVCVPNDQLDNGNCVMGGKKVTP